MEHHAIPDRSTLPFTYQYLGNPGWTTGVLDNIKNRLAPVAADPGIFPGEANSNRNVRSE